YRHRLVRCAGFLGLRVKFADGRLVKKSEKLQITGDVAVVGANPELVELIDAGPARIQPDGARLGLAELGSVGLGDERQGEAIDGTSEFFATKLDAGGDVAPLVAAADLQLAFVVAAQDVKVEGLEQHIAELGVADARL